MTSANSFGARSTLEVGGSAYEVFQIGALQEQYDVARLPYTLRILLENLLRHEDGETVTRDAVEAVARWSATDEPSNEITFTPSRVLLQDFTGVPAIVDLAAMRDAVRELGGDPARIDPLVPAELVIDHSVQVDEFGTRFAIRRNAELEFERNRERYAFLRWGQQAFGALKVVPPNTGICHQVNIEYLARVVEDREGRAFPDTLLGTDSHTTMVNGLGVLGWGVGGIEAEAAMLGEPVSMLVPQVVGFKLTGRLPEGSTATDLVLTVTQILRSLGVVGKFVEYFGPGLVGLALADRATIGNMSPEYGATCGFFPVDEITLDYLRLTGRPAERIALVETLLPREPALARARRAPDLLRGRRARPGGRRAEPRRPTPAAGPGAALRGEGVVLRLARDLRRQLRQRHAGPGDRRHVPRQRPDDGPAAGADRARGRGGARERRPGRHGRGAALARRGHARRRDLRARARLGRDRRDHELHEHLEPQVMLGAGLLAKKAVERGLTRKPWVKSSLAPGSKVVTEYYERAGLTQYLEQLGFHTVGYGCTTCIGNSGPLPEPISQAVEEASLVVCSVLSGNRNFEARIHPEVKANYLASPPLVVAYALAGRMDVDLLTEPLGQDESGADVYLRDIWPSSEEIRGHRRLGQGRDVQPHIRRRLRGGRAWRALAIPAGDLYAWDAASTYVRRPPYFEGLAREPAAVEPVRAPAASSGSATRSRPITSRRRARSGRTARPAAT